MPNDNGFQSSKTSHFCIICIGARTVLIRTIINSFSLFAQQIQQTACEHRIILIKKSFVNPVLISLYYFLSSSFVLIVSSLFLVSDRNTDLVAPIFRISFLVNFSVGWFVMFISRSWLLFSICEGLKSLTLYCKLSI